MKKVTTVLLLSGLLLIPFVSLALEEGGTTSSVYTASSTRKDGKNTVREGLEGRKEAIKQAVEEKREEIAEKVKERLAEHISKVIERHNAALTRLENVARRIESRITKMEAEGVDVAKSKELLATAKMKITEASVSIAAVKPKADQVLAGDIRTLYPELKDLISVAKEDLKEAHAALIDVIKNLKPGQNKPQDVSKHSSSTAATSTSN